MIPILGMVIGILIGIFLPFDIPEGITVYVAVGILAGLDTVFGGAVADMQKRFDIRVFITGFIGNLLLALLLYWQIIVSQFNSIFKFTYHVRSPGRS